MSSVPDRILRYLLIAPALIVLLSLTVFPTVYLVGVSFTHYDPSNPRGSEFVGVANYARLVGDPELHNAVGNTVVFTLTAVGLELLLGLGFALLVDRYVRHARLLRTILLLPMMLPPIAVAILWRLLFQPQFGLLNDLLARAGGSPLLWTSGVDTAMASLVLVDVWEWTPFVFLMCLAGLASLPREPYEAAALDGAGAWRRFFDITLPLLRPILVVTVLLRGMDALRLFDQVYVLTGGGPAGATETVSYYIYKVAFRFLDVGYGAAVSLAVLGATLLVSMYCVRRLSPEGSR